MRQRALSDEECRVLKGLIDGTFTGTEPSVIVELVRMGYVTSEDGQSLAITQAGKSAYLRWEEQGRW
jgi:hypothetical protein